MEAGHGSLQQDMDVSGQAVAPGRRHTARAFGLAHGDLDICLGDADRTAAVTRVLAGCLAGFPDREAAENLVHGRDLPAHLHRGPFGRLTGSLERPRDVARHPAQVFARDVGTEADGPFHVIAVVLARHRAGADLGHVAQEQRVAPGALDRDRLDLVD